jgi:hypothetical protein
MAASTSSPPSPAGPLTLRVRELGGATTVLEVTIDSGGTVSDLKEQISVAHAQKPAPSRQRVRTVPRHHMCGYALTLIVLLLFRHRSGALHQFPPILQPCSSCGPGFPRSLCLLALHLWRVRSPAC